MSISGIFSSNLSNHQADPNYRLTNSQFQQLGQDLVSGNLSAAQSDFATLEQAFTQPAAVSSSSTSNPVAEAFQQLATDLKSGNLSAAQQDYSTIQQDLQNLPSSRRLHNHHHIEVKFGVGQSSLQDSSATPDSSSAIAGSSTAAAQQAYTTVQQLIAGDVTGVGSTNPSRTHLAEPPVYNSPVSFMA